ncbi:MAG: efflux RND transporter permease subunit [Patescibacteria group bacterium]
MDNNHQPFLVRWSRFFIDRYKITIVILIAIVLAGLWGVSSNQRQDFPDIPSNYIFITAVYPGASPADVEKEAVVPIEQAVNQVEGVGSIRSEVSSSFAFISVEMESIPRTEAAAVEINNELAKTSLPDEVEVNVEVLNPTPPNIALGVVGTDGQSISDLLAQASEVLPRIETASTEIERVDIFPEDKFKIIINLKADQLAAAGLSYDLVKQSIQSQIISLPGGKVEDDAGRQQFINIQAPAQTIEDIRNINLGAVTLGSIADIVREPTQAESLHFGGYVKDGKAYAREAVYLIAYKKSNGDNIRINQAIDQEIDEMRTAGVIKDGFDVVTLYDTAPAVEDSISSLLNNGYLGLILILIVLLFFINLRTALVVSLIIPLAFLMALFVLHAIDYSLNILTLFAMILTLGILIDNAIVIAEGIVYELERGAKKRDAALAAVRKLGPAVTAATVTTVVVFIPFASLGGLIGQFLKYIPYTIIIMLVGSYLLAISITPLLGMAFMKEETYEEIRNKKIKNWQKILFFPALVFYGQRFIDWIRGKYRILMQRILPSGWGKLTVVIITTALMIVSFGVFAPGLKFEQFPSNDSELINVTIDFPIGTLFADKKEVFMAVQDEIISLPYFQTFYSFDNIIYVTFTQPKERTDDTKISDIENELKGKLAVIEERIDPEIDLIAEATTYSPPTSPYDIVVEFVDADPAKLEKAADDLVAFISAKEGVLEVFNGLDDLLQDSVIVDLDQAKLSEKAVNPLIAAQTVNAVFAEQAIGSLVTRTDGVSDDLALAFSSSATDSIDDLRDLLVPTLTGGVVTLNDVATVEKTSSLNSISRANSQRVAVINISLAEEATDQEKSDFEQSVKDYLSQDKLQEFGLREDSVIYGGLFAAFAEDYGNLQIIFLLAMIMVYIVLVNQFNSFMQPLLILFTVPLALIGVFPGLMIMGSSLNMISGLGVVALVGIVVNDAIVFIDTYNRNRKAAPNEDVAETLARTGRDRFKPIFSTSITTIGGILPLTILDPFWTGLGTSIIAGLIFSTIGTLIAIPVLYKIWCSLGRKLSRKKTSQPAL